MRTLNYNKISTIKYAACIFILSFWFSASAFGEDLKFILLTDLHITPGNNQDKIFPDIIKAVEDMNPEFIIIAGDLTNQGNNIELENVAKRLSGFKKKIYVLPGNHETTWSESAGKTYKQLLGDDRFVVETKDYTLCGINTGPFMRMSDGHVKAEDIIWLKSLKSEKPVIFISHYPLNDGLGNFTSLTPILKNLNTKVAFCGHEHRFYLYNTDSIPQIVCNALLSGENEWGFSLITINENEAKCKYFTLNKEDNLNGKDIYKSVAKDSMVIDFETKNWAKNTGLTPYPEQNGGALPENWSHEMVIKEEASLFTGICIDDNKMMYGTSDGRMICRNIDNGNLIWSYPTGHPLYSTPVVWKNIVMFGSCRNEVVALDINSGKKVWSVPTKAPVTSDPAIANNKLFIGAGTGRFMKINPKNGKVEWSFDGIRENGRLQGAPAIKDGHVVFGAWDTYLYCLNEKTGELIWKWNNGKTVDLYSPGNVVPVVTDNRVLLVAPDRYFTILDLKTGNQLSRTKKYTIRESLAYDEKTKHAFGKTMDGELVCVPFPSDSVYNESVVDMKMGYEHNPCMAFISDGIVYSGSRKGEIVLTTSKDNQFVGIVKCGNSSVLNFARRKNGEVFALLTEGTIWKFSKKK
ncbi:MAG: PQQ-binding-like beta-propeller repeat protein [Bacteroidales bacterium]|nr:PQQ-binding-like beta-propeller repeat protein [Bacteroidales bacterium]